MAYPVFRASSGHYSTTAGGSSLSLPTGLPTGWQAGDACFLTTYAYDNDSTSDPVINTPSGWTLVDTMVYTYQANSRSRWTLFFRFLQGGDTAPTVTGSTVGTTTSSILAAGLIAYSGCDTTTPYEGVVGLAATTSGGVAAGVAVTTTGTDRIVLNLFQVGEDEISDPASGWTERHDSDGSAGGDVSQIYHEIQKATAGTQSAGAATSNPLWAGDDDYGVWGVALVPVGGGGGGSIGSGAGASAGAATAQATGASNRAAAGASSGVATAQATGASNRAGSGASAGVATAQATGSAVIPAVGASSGIATAQATGDVAGSVGSGAGASTGLATAQATGAATSAATGAGSGLATAQATGSATFAAVGAVAGTSTASAVGEAQAAGSGVGSASGSSTAQATGASIAAATGTSSGVASVTGIAYSDAPVSVQGDGDILGRQFAVKRSKRDKDPRSAMQRLIDQFLAANAPKVKNAPKAVQSAVKAGEKAAQTIIPKLAPYVAPATLVRWDEALDELRQSQAREAQQTEQLTKAIAALRDLEKQAREAEDEEEAEMLLLAA